MYKSRFSCINPISPFIEIQRIEENPEGVKGS